MVDGRRIRGLIKDLQKDEVYLPESSWVAASSLNWVKRRLDRQYDSITHYSVPKVNFRSNFRKIPSKSLPSLGLEMTIC